jgi:GNAT superfamily N-acetyltransferase
MPVILASERDFMDVMFLLSRCTADMNRRSMFHWNRAYPDAQTILSDIRARTLYLYHVRGVCQGIVVLNQEQAEEYRSVKWECKAGKILAIHRLAVHPLFQHKGIGRLLLEFSVDHARREGYHSIRLDVIQNHPDAAKIYTKLGFRETGSFHLPFQQSPFVCYELGL